jgi:hypothetical protein
MNDHFDTLKVGEEYVPSDEDALIEVITKVNLALLDRAKKPVPRGQHPKQHGCVEAEFVVQDDLPVR